MIKFTLIYWFMYAFCNQLTTYRATCTVLLWLDCSNVELRWASEWKGEVELRRAKKVIWRHLLGKFYGVYCTFLPGLFKLNYFSAPSRVLYEQCIVACIHPLWTSDVNRFAIAITACSQIPINIKWMEYRKVSIKLPKFTISGSSLNSWTTMRPV